MNSKLKGLIVCGVCVVCLGIVALALTLTGKMDTDDSSNDDSSSQGTTSVSKEETPIVDYDKTQVKSIVVENTYGTLNFTQTSSGSESWEIDELEGIEQNATLTGAAAKIAATLSYQDIAEENASDLSKYGLAEPASTFTVSYADIDKTVKTFLIGNESPNSGYYYLCEKDSATVYTVNGTGLQYFMSEPELFVNTTLLASPSDDNSWPDILDLIVWRDDWDYDVKFKTVDETESVVSSQIMYEPIVMSLNITSSSDVTHGLWGLQADSAVKAFPTDEDKENYGITNPHAVVTLKLDTEQKKVYTLTIGKAIHNTDDDGNDIDSIAGYYVYFEGVDGKDVIYAVSVDSLPWATFSPEDVMVTFMTSNYIYNVDTIEIIDGDNTTLFDLIGEGEDAPTEVTQNGQNVDVDSFKSLYQYILTCPTNEIYFEETDLDPYVTISINLKNGTSDVIQIVKQTDRRSVAFLNGKPQFLIAKTWTDLLTENIENLKNGLEIKEFV